MSLKFILVTGGCGFIASNFINRISSDIDTSNKYFIINIDNLSEGSDISNVNKNISNYVLINDDIRNEQALIDIFEKYDIEYIFHFAAQTHVDRSFIDPIYFADVNIIGTTTLLITATRYCKNIKRFIFVSTDEVANTDETSLGDYDPTNPYSASKAGAELMVNAFHYSYKLPVIITRSHNIFGKNQNSEKFIPKCVEKLMTNQKIPIYGDGSCLRNYLHIDDAIDAFKLIMEKGEIGEMYELESKQIYSAFDLARKIIEIVKNNDTPFSFENSYDDYLDFIDDRPFHDTQYYVDSTSLLSLGWKQRRNFHIELKKYVRSLMKSYS